MKRSLLSILLCGVLLISLTGCGSTKNIESETLEDKIENKVRGIVLTDLGLSGNAKSALVNTTTIKKISDTSYKIYGTVEGKDNYGRDFSGIITGTCTVSNDEVEDCNIEYD